MKAISKKLTEELYTAACDLFYELRDNNFVAQRGDNGEYGNESAVGQLNIVLGKIDTEYEKA